MSDCVNHPFCKTREQRLWIDNIGFWEYYFYTKTLYLMRSNDRLTPPAIMQSC